MEGQALVTAPRLLYTAESVTEGHPDKVCDQISDAILDAYLAQDPAARVACECVATKDLVIIAGEVTSRASVGVPSVVRDTIRRIGYDDPALGFAYQSVEVEVHLKEQAADIAIGVDRAQEARGSGRAAVSELDKLGAGDQGMMIGFACDETPELMPLPISLAHRLARRLAEVRKDGTLPYLRPDGKTQVTVEYRNGKPARVATVVVSTQHAERVDQATIRDDLLRHVVRPVIGDALLDEGSVLHVNPTGRFVMGGPLADVGLTGRKIIVDTYGGMARHGGGCFSGKDPTKVDRSAAYAARYVAKNVVAAGLAERLEVQVAYAIGVARPVSISIEAFGTNRVPLGTIQRLVEEHFDLRPAAIIRDLGLRRPIYLPTAAYGHFGRDDLELPWERTDRAGALRRALDFRA